MNILHSDMLHISLFSGIGGFDLASQWMGWKNIVSCEINDFGNKVLQYYWPQAYHHKDIHTLTYETINAELTAKYGPGWRDDDIIITGGFPCQPFSMAGKRKGTDDERHLWPQMLRVIREVQPRWVVGENVPGIVNWSGGLVFEQVQADLEAEGYEVQAFILPACGVNAPHRRDRVWIVAYAGSSRHRGCAKKTGSDFTERNGKLVSNIGQYGDEIWGEIKRCGKVTANPTSDGLHDKPAKSDNAVRADNIESRTRRFSTAEGFSNERPTPDTEKTIGQPTSGTRTGRIGFTDVCAETITPDNDSNIRCERRMHTPGHEQAERHAGSCDTWFARPAWQNFPTQSPVCGRNDGISSGLAGITVSKHRNESIKAYGNAIVPQVVYKIFKTIEQFDMICTNHTCTIQDYCWTYGKPYDRHDRQVNVQPEQDDEAGFVCKEFEDYPPMAINEMI